MANTIEPGSSLAQLIPYVFQTSQDVMLTQNRTLDLSQVPAKLHCPTCHGFLVNAYKTSCCEQTICEPCKITKLSSESRLSFSRLSKSPRSLSFLQT